MEVDGLSLLSVLLGELGPVVEVDVFTSGAEVSADCWGREEGRVDLACSLTFACLVSHRLRNSKGDAE